jgi:hypothetical protein
MDDRRSNGRTRISKAASLFFGGKAGTHSCDVKLTDITNGGAGIYKQGLAVLPLTFELSFDDLRRKCRLIWRKGNFFGVAFESQDLPADDDSHAVEAEVAIPQPAFSILNDPPESAFLGNAGMLSESMSIATYRKDDLRADLRFMVGVAVVLAMPVLVSMSAYIAMTALLW